MVNVEKRNGRMEPFQRTKLVTSIKKAGASESIAQKIADKVESKVYEGMSTANIRKMVLTMLQKLSKKAWTTYKSYKKQV